jgi:hypothetical protein
VALLVAGNAECDQSFFHGDGGVTFVDICVSLSNSILLLVCYLDKAVESSRSHLERYLAAISSDSVIRRKCLVFRSARSDIPLSICRSHDAYALQFQHSQPTANRQASARPIRARIPLYYSIQFDSFCDLVFSAQLANGVQSINTPFAGRKTNSRRVPPCRACDHQTKGSPEAPANGPKTVRMTRYHLDAGIS